MKILLIGARGMIGSRILAEAVGRGHTLIAATRHALKKADTSGKVTEKMLDATNARAIADAAAGADVIVSATSPRGGGDAIAEAAAVGDALIEAAGIASKRLFVVGGAGSLTFPDGKPVAETVPAFNVYVSYANFTGQSATSQNPSINVVVSSDCGKTFSKPNKISTGGTTSQGSAIAAGLSGRQLSARQAAAIPASASNARGSTSSREPAKSDTSFSIVPK